MHTSKNNSIKAFPQITLSLKTEKEQSRNSNIVHLSDCLSSQEHKGGVSTMGWETECEKEAGFLKDLYRKQRVPKILALVTLSFHMPLLSTKRTHSPSDISKKTHNLPKWSLWESLTQKNHLRYFKHFGLWGQLDKLVFLILISMRPCADLAAFYALGIKEITVWRLKMWPMSFPYSLEWLHYSAKPELLTAILLTCACRMRGLLFILIPMVTERRVRFLGPAFSISTGATSVHICRDDGYIHCDFLSTGFWWFYFFFLFIKVHAI